MYLFRKLLVVLLALMLTACAAPKLTAEQAASIKTVGVISLLPQELKYRKIGVTVFNNEFKTLPVANDVFNAHARKTAEQLLTQSGKYKVKQIMVNDVAGMASRLNARTMIMSNTLERIEKEVTDLAKANGVDAVVVIAEQFNSEQGVFGLTMLLHAGMSEIRHNSAMAGIQVTGVTAGKEFFMGRYADPTVSTKVARPDNQPWNYKLEDNLDPATHNKVVQALLPVMAGEIDKAMKEAALY